MFRRRPTEASALLRQAVFDGHEYGLQFAYVDGLSSVLRRHQARLYRQPGHAYHNAWRIPKRLLHEQVEPFFQALREVASQPPETLDSFVGKLDTARTRPVPGAFSADVQVSIACLKGGQVLARGTYHPGLVALYRRMRGVFVGPSKAWRISATPQILISNLVDALDLQEHQIEVLQGIHEILEDGALAQSKEWQTLAVGGVMPEPAGPAEEDPSENEVYLASVPAITPVAWTPDALNVAIGAYDLYDFQKTGVAHLVMRTSALLADDMGLGKTRQAIAAAAIRAEGRPVLIVCLASLVTNWGREIQAVRPRDNVALQTFSADAQWVVMNYERLGRIVTHAAHFTVMVIDEAHRLKEPTTEWTRHAFDLASQIPNRYLLTGTPVPNRESELHTLLRLSGHPIGQMSLRDFCDQFAGSSTFRVELRRRIADWMLRRTKDVLPNLKGKQRQPFAVELTPQQRAQYQCLLNADKPSLAILGDLRAFLERVKAEIIPDLVLELDAADKVLIFCEFLETVHTLTAALAAAGISSVSMVGSMSRTQRQKAEDRFQTDDDVRVLVATTAVAGTGLNLTAANYVIFASLPWTPAQQEQAEDRAYRNGQLRLVIVKIPLVQDTIDLGIWDMLDAKRAISRDIMEPIDEDGARAEFARRLAS